MAIGYVDHNDNDDEVDTDADAGDVEDDDDVDEAHQVRIWGGLGAKMNSLSCSFSTFQLFSRWFSTVLPALTTLQRQS